MLHSLQRSGGLVAAHVLHIRGPLDAALLRRAFTWLQERHAILGAHIESRGLGVNSLFPFLYRKLWWVVDGTGPVPIREAQGDWREVLRAELDTRFPDGNLPRFRVTVVSEADLHHLIVVSDHAAGDAQAAFAGIRDFLTFIGDPEHPPAAAIAGLPPGLESGHTASSNPARPHEPALRFPGKPLWRNPRDTLTEKRVLSREETAALNAAVKAKRATLHGAVTAAMLKAGAARFSLERLSALSNVELRKLMKPPLSAEAYGCYIDVLRTTHDTGQPFWALARDVAFRLITALARHQHQASALKQPEAEWYRHELWPTIMSDGGMDAFAVTTGGETGIARQYGAFTLEDMDVVVSLNPVGSAVYVLAAETQGRLTVNFCWAGRRIAREDALAILDDAMALLRAPPAD